MVKNFSVRFCIRDCIIFIRFYTGYKLIVIISNSSKYNISKPNKWGVYLLDKTNFKNRASIYIKSLIAGLAVCLILMFILSLIMRFTPITEKWIQHYSLGIVAFACMFTGITAGYYKQKMGMLNGLIHSIVLILVLFVIYFFAVESMSLKDMVHIRHLFCLACGAVGGMIGVNAK